MRGGPRMPVASVLGDAVRIAGLTLRTVEVHVGATLGVRLDGPDRDQEMRRAAVGFAVGFHFRLTSKKGYLNAWRPGAERVGAASRR